MKQTKCNFCGKVNKMSKKQQVKVFVLEKVVRPCILKPCGAVLAVFDVNVDMKKFGKNEGGRGRVYRKHGNNGNSSISQSVVEDAVESVKTSLQRCASFKSINQYLDGEGLKSACESLYGSKSSLCQVHKYVV